MSENEFVEWRSYQVYCNHCDTRISSGLCDPEMWGWALKNDKLTPNYCKKCGGASQRIVESPDTEDNDE